MNHARKEAEVEIKKSPKTDKIPKVYLERKNSTNFIAKPGYVRFMKRANVERILLIVILPMVFSSYDATKPNFVMPSKEVNAKSLLNNANMLTGKSN